MPRKKINSTLVFRARAKGFHIDTKSRRIQILISKQEQANDVYVKRLVNENNFQVEFVTAYTKDLRVYISGPIAHYDINERKEAFKFVEDTLRLNDYHPVNPFRNGVDENAPDSEHLKADIKMLANCEAIYFMGGWTKSKGCKLEFECATAFGLEILNIPRE